MLRTHFMFWYNFEFYANLSKYIFSSYTSPFDSIKQLDDEGNEYRYARDLQGILEYSEWRNFYKIIDKAKNACEASGHVVQSEFVDVNKLVDVGANLQRSIQDIVLSRYACYLIAMNGDPRKEVIALAQTYFAVKTHKQEQLELQKEDSLCLQIDLHPFSWTDNKKNPHNRAGLFWWTTRGSNPGHPD